jgi:hypothetical protein
MKEPNFQMESQKYTHIAEVDFETSEVDKKYADGLGKVDDCETLFIESSSGLQHENIVHTLEDTLKLIIECNGALGYTLSQLKKCNFESALKKSTFGIQVIKDTLTISHMQLKENLKCKFVELIFAQVLANWSNRYSWVKVFELVAKLYQRLLEEADVTADMKKEHIGLVSVPRERTLSSHLELSPF